MLHAQGNELFPGYAPDTPPPEPPPAPWVIAPAIITTPPAPSSPLVTQTPRLAPTAPTVPSSVEPPRKFPPALNGSAQKLIRLTHQTPSVLIEQITSALPGGRIRSSGPNNGFHQILDAKGNVYVALSKSMVGKAVVVSGSSAAVNQASKLVVAFDQTSISGIKSIVVPRRHSGLLKSKDTSKAESSKVVPVQYVQQAQATEPLGGRQLDPLTRQRLRDLGDDVQVEVLPDLDVVILRGRDQDIDELSKIIKRLEEMAQGAQPKIEVYQLEHVPGESLAEIIEEIAPEYTGPLQGRIAVTPLGKPNALLLVGWGSALQATIDLIAKLDKPVAAETQLKVIPLKNAPAGEAAQTLQDFFDARPGLGPKVVVTADERTNSLIVNAAPRDITEVIKMLEQLDTDATSSVNQANVVNLQNTLAPDIATVLQQALTAAQAGGPDSRAAALELLGGVDGAEQILRSGDLSSVSVTPSPRTNSLIITGPADSVKMLRALIERLDSPRQASQIKIFRIVNGDAGSLVQVLRSLLVSSGGAGGGAAGGNLGLPNAENESSLAQLRFSVEDRTNNIIAIGPKGDLEIVEALLARLDEEGEQERLNAVYHLKNAPAADVARTINEFLRSERLLEQAGQGSVSATQLTSKEVIVVPEPVGNKLVLSATPQYFRQLNELIQRLDEAPPQVMIQVLIGEVQLSNFTELGVELGIQNSILFDRSLLEDLNLITNSTQQETAAGIVTVTEQIIAAATNSPGFNFNGSPLPGLGNSGSTLALNNSNSVGTQGLGNFGVGRNNGELGFGGLVLSASSESVSVLIRALQESRKLEVLSRPQIRTLDNQPAFIQVGQVVPYITNSTITQFGQTNSIDFRDVGLILGVTPRISPDGTVVMEIDAEKSTVGPEEQGIPIAATQDGLFIRAPSIETTRAQTTVSAASGETIVLGGLISKSKSSTVRGVPYLSDIPLIGDLFRYEIDDHQRSELLIILTPRVIRNSADSEAIKQAEMARMSWCAADVYELHGDVNYHFTEDALNFNAPVESIYPMNDPTGGIGPQNGILPQGGALPQGSVLPQSGLLQQNPGGVPRFNAPPGPSIQQGFTGGGQTFIPNAIPAVQ